MNNIKKELLEKKISLLQHRQEYEGNFGYHLWKQIKQTALLHF